ncbi:MAG: spore coat protein GerQ [Bacilli bacterium]|jgi:spore germination protein Q
MNGNYYQKPIFSTQPITPNQAQAPTMAQPYAPGEAVPPFLPLEASYIENILRLNRGKQATVYMSFTDSKEWGDKVFTGTIEEAGRDHLILSNPQTGTWYLLKIIYLDYVTFEEPIEYSTIFAQPPRP